MRKYTLDGIELALKAIEHRKDCKTAAGIIRKLITTESMKKGKHCGYMTATEVLSRNQKYLDKRYKKHKQLIEKVELSIIKQLMKKVGL